MAEDVRTQSPDPEPSPAETSTDDDALILWMLSLTPAERLQAAQGFIDSVEVLRRGRSA